YQAAVGLPQTGLWDEAIKAVVFNGYTPYGRSVEQVQAAVGVEQDGGYGYNTYRAVRAKQLELNKSGYKAGTADGKWGMNTNSAYDKWLKDTTPRPEPIPVPVPEPQPIEVDLSKYRIAGVNRYDTAAQAAVLAFP